MPFYLWSKTPASNGTADPTCPFPEGMAPSAVNDGNRGQMAALARWGADIAGAIVTSGTATAYSVSSFSGYDTLAHLDGQMIAFSPHTTNGATVTLNVDALGARPLRSAPGVEILAGTIIQGTPYTATYNNADGAFYLQGFFGNPYNIPLAGGMDFWGTTVPNNSFAFPIGQAISRTTYAALFSIMGTTYGVGDGSTTFNLPDKTGRVSAMKEASATRLTTGVSGVDGATMGSAAGSQSETLTLAQLPTGITVAGTVTVSPSGGGNIAATNGNISGLLSSTGSPNVVPQSTAAEWHNAGTLSGTNTLTSNNTNGQLHPNVQPTIVCNYIIRII